MTTEPKRGGPRPGAGQKPKDPSGEPMKPHAMRWTDAGWADVLLIGMDRVRELVRQEAEKVRISKDDRFHSATGGWQTTGEQWVDVLELSADCKIPKTDGYQLQPGDRVAFSGPGLKVFVVKDPIDTPEKQ